MLDKVYLLIAGIVAAAGAWAFFRFAGDSAFEILSTIAIVVGALDNARLRKELAELRKRVPPPSAS